MNTVVVAMTGASGAVYGRSCVQALLASGHAVELVVSAAARRVFQAELGRDVGARGCFGEREERLTVHAVEDVGARIASGSYPVSGMAIVPCSMGTVGRIAAGLSSNLVERAADVQMKERRPLVLVVRESPFSVLHLENLLRLARAGATVLPAAPGFYHRPERIEDLVRFVVERTLAALGVAHEHGISWRGEAE